MFDLKLIKLKQNFVKFYKSKRLFSEKALKLSEFKGKTKATNSRGAVAHARNLIRCHGFFTRVIAFRFILRFDFAEFLPLNAFFRKESSKMCKIVIFGNFL